MAIEGVWSHNQSNALRTLHKRSSHAKRSTVTIIAGTEDIGKLVQATD